MLYLTRSSRAMDMRLFRTKITLHMNKIILISIHNTYRQRLHKYIYILKIFTGFTIFFIRSDKYFTRRIHPVKIKHETGRNAKIRVIKYSYINTFFSSCRHAYYSIYEFIIYVNGNCVLKKKYFITQHPGTIINTKREYFKVQGMFCSRDFRINVIFFFFF